MHLPDLLDAPHDFLEHADAAVRRLAVSTCAGRLGEAAIREAIEARLVMDGDGAVRAQCIDVLAGAGEDVVELILDARLDEDMRVVEAAATALGEIGALAGVPWLLEAAARHPERLVREAAVASLGEIGDPRAVPTLLHVLRSGPPQVRRRAVVALTVFDDSAIEPALEEARSDRNPMVREVVEMVIGRAPTEWQPIDLQDPGG